MQPVSGTTRPGPGGVAFFLTAWVLLAAVWGAILSLGFGTGVLRVPGSVQALPADAQGAGQQQGQSGPADSSTSTPSTPDPSVQTSSAQPPSAQSPTSAVTVTVAPAPSPSQARPATTTVTVVNTCGADGTGDCFLSERAGPDSDTSELRRWDEGDNLQVICQVHGTGARSSVLNARSTVWSKTTSGGWVATIYLDGVDKFDVTTPCR